MTHEEVLRNASISYETLRRWVNAGLVPTPKRGNMGRAGGRWSEYPPETVWEIAAAAHLLKAHSMKQVAEIRALARSFIAEICVGELSDILVEFEEWQKENTVVEILEGDRGAIDGWHEKVPDASESPYEENTETVDTMVFSWLMARYKSEYDVPLDFSAQVQIECFSWWEIKEGDEGYGDDTKTVEQCWSSATHTVFVDWRVTKVDTHLGILEDEIVVHDKDTDIRLILRPFKKRKS